MCHNVEDIDLNLHRRENLKPQSNDVLTRPFYRQLIGSKITSPYN